MGKAVPDMSMAWLPMHLSHMTDLANHSSVRDEPPALGQHDRPSLAS